VAVDYKSGSSKPFDGLTHDNPTANGSKFQLPVYALAAQQAEGPHPTRSEYWFTSRKGGFTTVGYDVDASVLGEVTSALKVVVDGIRSGVFPARPVADSGAWSCEACDLVGAAPIQAAWERKVSDPRLADYLRMLRGGHD
jgi:hypothetical protein